MLAFITPHACTIIHSSSLLSLFIVAEVPLTTHHKGVFPAEVSAVDMAYSLVMYHMITTHKTTWNRAEVCKEEQTCSFQQQAWYLARRFQSAQPSNEEQENETFKSSAL